MSLHFIVESQTSFMTSTPIRASQGSFTKSPIDSMVPKTPSIACRQYSNDQQVPLKPVTQFLLRSPTNSTSVPVTPVKTCKTSTTSTEPTLCLDNQDENLSVWLVSVDQIVPSTPECGDGKSSRKEDYFEQPVSSHQAILVHENIDSCIGDPYSLNSSKFLSATNPRQLSHKGLSLAKCGNNQGCSTSTSQSLTGMRTLKKPAYSADSNETSALSFLKSSSQQSHEMSDAVPEILTSPSENMDLPSQNKDTPLPLASVSTSYMLPSVSTCSNARFEASTTGAATIITREELTRRRRPVSQMEGAHCFQVRNQDDLFQDPGQLNLFDGDDIFG